LRSTLCPYTTLFRSGYFKQADGMEIYDIADAMREKIIDVPRELLQFVLTSDQYPEELMLSVVERMNWHLAQWDTLTRERRFVGVDRKSTRLNSSHQI